MYHSRPARKVRAYRPRLEILEDRTLLSTYLVDHLADDMVGTGLSGSLRYAITNAVDGDAITFGVTGTINLSGSLPNLTHNITINGPGANLLTVRRDTGGNYGIFRVGATVAISGLTIANGRGTGYDSAGGIYNEGSLTVSNCTVLGNFGGGIFNDEYSSLTVSNCTVTQNQSFPEEGSPHADGGGILNYGGTATVNNCTITNNTGAWGGGIANEFYAAMTIANSTISANTARAHGDDLYFSSRGGGIYNGVTWIPGGGGSDLFVTNSTITGNVTTPTTSSVGGGIASYGSSGDPSTLTINNCTISGNSAPGGGGTYSSGGGIIGSANMRNTILAGNSAGDGPDLNGALRSSGYNLIGNSQGGSGFVATDLLNVNPLLGPLQNNSGPTQTMALLASSPALNAGDPTQLGVPDQRDVVRSGGVNIGAYQASASAFVLIAPATVTAGTPFDVTVKAVDPFGQVAFGYTGTVTFSVTDPDPAVVLPPDYTFTAGDQGTHTFPGGVTLLTPGTWTLTVADLANGLSKDVMLTVIP
jgi:hypothetical protein